MKRIVEFIIRYVYAAMCCLYLFTVGFIFAKNRSLISDICTHFGFGKKPDKTVVEAPIEAIIPQIDLSEIIPESASIQILELVTVDGNISLLETIIIAKLIKHYNPSKLFEIGTFDGRTTLNMAANCSEQAKVYTLDLPKDKLYSTKLPIVPVEKKYIDKEISRLKYLGTDCEKKVVQLYGDSATFDFSPFFNMIDFMFIDGSHSYEYVLNDSKQALKMLKNGQGLILWHDYNTPFWQGVTRALNELYETSEFRGLKHITGTSFVCLMVE